MADGAVPDGAGASGVGPGARGTVYEGEKAVSLRDQGVLSPATQVVWK